MPLTWDITEIEMYKDNLDDAWVKYDFLPKGSQDDLKPLLKSLIFAGGMIGLNEITASNVADWYARLKLCENMYNLYITRVFNEETEEIENISVTAKDVITHVGLRTNHSKYSQSEWLKLVLKNHKDVTLTIPEMNKLLKTYKDNFIKEIAREI